MVIIRDLTGVYLFALKCGYLGFALQDKMEALQLQHNSKGKPYTEVEIFAAVLGTKAGYVCGLGRLVRFVGSSSLVSFVDLSRRLEEARLEIEEMRARQMEYEELWSSGQKWSRRCKKLNR
ncbi:hypothetical protein CJ030_MR3G003075 [Morella rubra]|uniref:Uncharacterized protein n=1 Tax=Morella rubra TaxID=262757 RepID=A0A6A1W580_9ROSI|nr:hypothetical protein CJ030_MR3G003075 [Morella rubra]